MNEPDSSNRTPHGTASRWQHAVAALLADPEQAALARDCYFDGTVVEAGQRYWASEEWQAARLLLPHTVGEALDLGAGRGIASYALARDGWRVAALEPDQSTLVGAGAIRSLVSVTGYPIEIFEAYGEQLPFANERFGLIVARQALHHARDLRALLTELYRVLRPHGRLVALRDHVITRSSDLARFHGVHPLHRFYGGEQAYLLEQYTVAIKEAGFSLKRVIAPFESPINYAPLTRETLADGIVGQLPDFPGLRNIVRRSLRSAPLMALTLRLLRAVDNRPGRLYSFVADRPGD